MPPMIFGFVIYHVFGKKVQKLSLGWYTFVPYLPLNGAYKYLKATYQYLNCTYLNFLNRYRANDRFCAFFSESVALTNNV